MITPKNNARGFTIVELLIVIVVIGILAATSTVAYSGVRERALNSGRFSEMKAWEKQLELYHSINGSYPNVPNDEYCLGTGHPNGKCRDHADNSSYTYNEADSAALHTQLRTVGSLPSGPRIPIDGTVGPYITYWGTGYWISQVFHGGAGDCPSGTIYS